MTEKKVYKIEKKIPIPGVNVKYPFVDMVVGDSFVADRKAAAAAYQYGVTHNCKFTSRVIAKGSSEFRIWRTE